MLKVAVVGASGYTGIELLRILHCHPEVAVACVTSERSAGKTVAEIFPSVRDCYTQVLEHLEPVRVADKADFIFTALPHQAAMEVVPTFMKLGKKVVDLSADYRFRDPAVYEKWYEPHMNPEVLAQAVYGLPEIRRAAIAEAGLVGNPGCYPTSVILGLAPLLHNGLIDSSSIIADSKSAASGAGRGAKVDTLFCEVNEGFKAYGVASHRHTPEIEQELSLLAGKEVTISFTPHLVPMDGGYSPPSMPLTLGISPSSNCWSSTTTSTAMKVSSGSFRPGLSRRPCTCGAPTSAISVLPSIAAQVGSSWFPPLTTWSREPPDRRSRT